MCSRGQRRPSYLHTLCRFHGHLDLFLSWLWCCPLVIRRLCGSDGWRGDRRRNGGGFWVHPEKTQPLSFHRRPHKKKERQREAVDSHPLPVMVSINALWSFELQLQNNTFVQTYNQDRCYFPAVTGYLHMSYRVSLEKSSQSKVIQEIKSHKTYSSSSSNCWASHYLSLVSGPFSPPLSFFLITSFFSSACNSQRSPPPSPPPSSLPVD